MRQLFIDDQMVQQIDGLRRVVNQPAKHPDNPILKREHPWEVNYCIPGVVLYDGEQKQFRMWYGCSAGTGEESYRRIRARGRLLAPWCSHAAYATSEDGIHWTKPILNQVDFEDSTENNLLDVGRENPSAIGPIYDPDDPDPNRRYKVIYWEHSVIPEDPQQRWYFLEKGDGIWVSFSPDGLHWSNFEKNPVLSTITDGSSMALWDPRLEQYVYYARFQFGRRVARVQSPDFTHWTQPQLVLEADQQDGEKTQFYYMHPSIYEGIYVGMVGMFREGGDARIDVQLVSSRDGIDWQRVGDRQTFLPNGPVDAWDGGNISVANAPVVLDDRLLIYYAACRSPHPPRMDPRFAGRDIGLATLRRDGFVSLDAEEDAGYVLTKPFEVPAGALHVNAHVEEGEVQVAVTDESGRPLQGFERSDPLTEDALDATVKWQNESIQTLRQRKVCLRLTARKAKLYAYWFK